MSELWIPAVEVESAHGIREVSLRTRHLMDRRIFLTGQIDATLADAFLSQMLYMEQTESEPVTVYINSPGGEVNSGLMIYDAIVDSSLTVNTVCTGLAASMAAIILIGTVLAFTAYLKSVADLGGVKAGLLASVETLAAPLFAALWLDTRFVAADFVGFFCILAMVVLFSLPGLQAEKKAGSKQ